MGPDVKRLCALALPLLLAGCESADKDPALPALPPLAAGITAHQIADPTTYWQAHGFTVMTPAVPLPVKKGENSKVDVWVKLPEGQRLDVKEGPSGPVLVWPPGAEADRVESLKHRRTGTWRPGDVRGAQMLEAGDQMHRIYRPSKGWSGPMFGYHWRRSRLEHEEAVNARIEDHFRRGEGQLAPAKGQKLEKRIKLTLERGQCVACHRLEKPQAIKAEVPARMTDASGWFQAMSVLTSSVPLERYRGRMVAALHPYVSMSCPDTHPPDRDERDDGTLRMTCRNNDAVMATIDIGAALTAGDEHAQAVCRSRRYLFDHMADRARRAFIDAFQECAIGTTSPQQNTVSGANP